jgi:hypothetical protein
MFTKDEIKAIIFFIEMGEANCKFEGTKEAIQGHREMVSRIKMKLNNELNKN